MRRFTSWFSILVISFVALVGLYHPATAQDATPASGDETMPPGVTFTPLAFGQAQQLMLPDQADLALFRISLDPGARYQPDANDPSTALVYIESGKVTLTVDAEVSVLRASTMTAMMSGDESASPAAESAPPFERIPANTEFQAETGDSFLVPGHVGGDLRNDGSEPVVLLIANVGPSEDQQATPVS